MTKVRTLEPIIKVDVHQGVPVYVFGPYVLERIPAKLVLPQATQPVLEAKNEISMHATYHLEGDQVPAIVAHCRSLRRKEQ